MSLLFRTRDVVKDTGSADISMSKTGATIRGKGAEWLSVSGVVDLVNLLPSVQSNTVGSIMFWCYMSDVTRVSDVLFDARGSGSISLEIFHDGITNQFFARMKDGVVPTLWQMKTSGLAPVNNKPFHFALVQDGVEPVIYFNGEVPTQSFSASTDKTGWWADATFTGINLGGLIGTGSFLGKLDDIQVWDEVLSDGFIANYYDQYYKYF